MKILIAYHSITGNTEKVARVLREALPHPADLRRFDEVDSVEFYDLLFIGFPAHQFGPSRRAVRFCDEKIAGKKTGIFVTCAMHQDSPGFEVQRENCRNILPEQDLLGFFSCRGALSEETAAHLMKSGDPRMVKFGQMREETLGFPGEGDMERAAEFGRNILGNIV